MLSPAVSAATVPLTPQLLHPFRLQTQQLVHVYQTLLPPSRHPPAVLRAPHLALQGPESPGRLEPLPLCSETHAVIWAWQR
jgi:hypothetical protein